MKQLLLSAVVLLSLSMPSFALEFYVAPDGSNANPGTKDRPFAAIARARDAIRQIKAAAKEPVTVYLRGGTYYLKDTVVFTAEDSGTIEAPVYYRAYDNEKPVISGALTLNLKWRPYKDGIMQAKVVRPVFNQLFINGKRRHRARYPNYNQNAKYFGGTAADAISPEKVKTWANPVGAIVHGLQKQRWGSLHYLITAVEDNGQVKLQGGDQVNRGNTPANEMHTSARYVENIFEELDETGEWYLDSKKGILYFIPPDGLDLAKARVEAVVLKQLFEFRGSISRPVRNIHLKGLTFTHTAHTFLQKYEPLLRGDWSIVRAGAVFMTGAVDCSVEDCFFDAVGGNGIFISNYNRRLSVAGCKFTDCCDNAVCLVGDFNAVRSASTWLNHIPDPPDKTVGPATENYPALCVIHNNLIHDIGLIGKQVAGVFISMASQITVSHNTIYHIPRAAICINDGTWGGHVIEFNDAFDMVRETGDHGPFNSWGRDRHWNTADYRAKETGVSPARSLCQLDNYKTTIIRNNRFEHRGSHSWGIDLDDGSSNYHLYNNLTLGCSFKLREGFFRLVENNICIGPYPPGKHVCYKQNGDVIRRNIYVNTTGTAVFKGIRAKPLEMSQIDYNLYYNYKAAPTVQLKRELPPSFKAVMSLPQWQAKGLDLNSVFADPLFVNAAEGDYRVRPESPALKLGFKNFPMDNFGVLKPRFRAEAEEGRRLFYKVHPKARQVNIPEYY